MRWKKIIKILLLYNFFNLLKVYYKKKMTEKELIILKQNENLAIYEKWINKAQKEKTINSYLIENGYYNIAIYGLGRLGKQLYRELSKSNVKIVYGIDCAISQYDKIKCYNPNESLENVDLIIVTVSIATDEIIAKLEKKVSCPIISIHDILFMI